MFQYTIGAMGLMIKQLSTEIIIDILWQEVTPLQRVELLDELPLRLQSCLFLMSFAPRVVGFGDDGIGQGGVDIIADAYTAAFEPLGL